MDIPAMIAAMSVLVLALTAAYLVGLGACALLRPALARRFLLGHASSPRLHYLELALRLLVGGALLVRAPAMPWPQAFTFVGWVLVVTTLVLALVPWRRHQAFAQRTVPQALRFLPLLGVASLGLGAGLSYAISMG
jgi:hypothetical protein